MERIIYVLAALMLLVGLIAAALAPTGSMGPTEAFYARLLLAEPAVFFSAVIVALGFVVAGLGRLERRLDINALQRGAFPVPEALPPGAAGALASPAPEPPRLELESVPIAMREAEPDGVPPMPPLETPALASPQPAIDLATPQPARPSILSPASLSSMAPIPIAPGIAKPFKQRDAFDQPHEPPLPPFGMDDPPPAPLEPPPPVDVPEPPAPPAFPLQSQALPHADPPPLLSEPEPAMPPATNLDELIQRIRNSPFTAEAAPPVLPEAPPAPRAEPALPIFDTHLFAEPLPEPPPPSPPAPIDRSPSRPSRPRAGAMVAAPSVVAAPALPFPADLPRLQDEPQAGQSDEAQRAEAEKTVAPVEPELPPPTEAIEGKPGVEAAAASSVDYDIEQPKDHPVGAVRDETPHIQHEAPHEPPSFVPADEPAAPVPSGPIAGPRAPTIAELLERDINAEPPEPAPQRVVREGQFAGRRYRMFEDGSLEIDTDQSTIRFDSLEEFRAFVNAASKRPVAPAPPETV